jgi:hypothetical protein
MKKILIYLALLIIFSISITTLADYTFWLYLSGFGWCASGALLLFNTMTYIQEKRKK